MGHRSPVEQIHVWPTKRWPNWADRAPRPLVTAILSALIPGAGHWYISRHRRGWLFFAPSMGAVVVGVILALRGSTGLLKLSVQPRFLWMLVVGNLLLMAIRVAAVIDAHRLARGQWRPSALPPKWVSGVGVLALVASIVAPHAVVTAYGIESIDVLNTVFDSEPTPGAITTTTLGTPLAEVADAGVVDAEPAADLIPLADPAFVAAPISPDEAREKIPLSDRNNPPATFEPSESNIFDAPFLPLAERVDLNRVTILLAGGDAGPGRGGLRTDTMIVATFDSDTGKAALFGVPRNLVQVPLPRPVQHVFVDVELELIERARLEQEAKDRQNGVTTTTLPGTDLPPGGDWESCHCFPRQLNALYPLTRTWNRSFPNSSEPGMEMLTWTMEGLLGLNIDYWVLVDMAGFVEVVDALGGVDVEVQRPVNTRVSPATEGGDWITINLEVGTQRLTGEEALAYVRSRYGTSDYDRMERQRCMLRSTAAAANPLTVLRNFPRIAAAVKHHTKTNIPLNFLPDLVEMVAELDLNDIATQAFLPGYYAHEKDYWGAPIPDVSRIRWKVDKILNEGLPDDQAVGQGECG